MKEQLEFSNAPWELRHCCNCDLCYQSLFLTKTFLKMSFLLKIMLPRHSSALENVMPYCHEAHCPSRLRRSFNVKFSRKIWQRWRQQHLSTTENIWYPKKGTVFGVSPSSSWQWDCCRLGTMRQGELPSQAPAVARPIGADGCGHLGVAYAQKTGRAS